MFKKYDVIVVGAGHAGCEAAYSSSVMGSSVLLITMNMNTIGFMSCNPAVGGIAKGQIVREIDAIGGMTGIISDNSMLQFRMLNRSKGPAVWSPRTQNDRLYFSKLWRLKLESVKNINFWQDTVNSIIVKNNTVIGVRTNMKLNIYSNSVILTNGTFLNGIIYIGKEKFSGGRSSEKSDNTLAGQLIDLGFKSGRMKTGTSPRVDGRTLDYSKMEKQYGDKFLNTFSFLNKNNIKKFINCYITYTNKNVHKILSSGFKDSPMFTNRIKGDGPRYCPSIEDKISKFSHKDKHQIFIEPEGWNTTEVYINGFSTSLPIKIQYLGLRNIKGFENVKMLKPGYAIEYTYFLPTQLKNTLETFLINNLYFAGQINGTTGYEEAACQGLMTGINSHRKINKLSPISLARSDAYIGVLINDLITKGTNEPYRMFTSRSEFRILLRQDNADLRLSNIGNNINLISNFNFEKVIFKKNVIFSIVNLFKKIKLFFKKNILNIKKNKVESQSLYKLLKRPEITFNFLFKKDNKLFNFLKNYNDEILEQIEIQIKYLDYIKKEKELVKKTKKMENFIIPFDFKYDNLTSLSSEGREKLKKFSPRTIGQALDISGISFSDISILILYISK